MADRYAKPVGGTHTAMVPQWSKDVRPSAQALVVGPPPGHDVTGDIRAVEMLVDDSDGHRTFFGYVRISKEAAQAMADEDGGWVEIGFLTPRLMPWSHVEYVALVEDEGVDRA